MTLWRRLGLLLAAAVLAAGLGASPALADDGEGRSGDNAAVAVNTKDGSSLFRFAFSIRRVAGEVVDNENVAVAYAQCESCRTVAIAIQIVLVSGSPDVVTPKNVAVAVNEGCSLCETFAGAYQWVLGTGSGQLVFTEAGRRELSRIRREFRRLGREELTLEELRLRVDELVARLRVVLKDELRQGEADEDDDFEDDFDEDEDDGGAEDEDRPAPPPATAGETTTTEPATTGTEPATTATEPATTTETTTPTETTP